MSTVNAPFLNVQSFSYEDAEAPAPVRQARPPAPWTPFLSVYESSNGDHEVDQPLREDYAALVHDLYDEEFDEALFELLAAGRGLHQDYMASGHTAAAADRVVTQHFSELMRESEAMVDAMAREFGSRSGVELEQEVEQFSEGYLPSGSLEPEFQDFLGKLAKKIGRGVKAVAKTAVKAAATLGLAPVLAKIKALVRPLLNNVLQKALGRLPATVQPAARRLAERLGFIKPAKPAPAPTVTPAPGTNGGGAQAPTGGDAVDAALQGAMGGNEPAGDATGSPVQAVAGTEMSEMQLEFDSLVAEAMLSEDEVQMELEVARINAAAGVAAPPVFSNLDDARVRLVQELEGLKEGESPAPYVENFLPAVLPAVKIATKLIGRPRVVGFLAGLLGKLISNLIGPQHAPALSRAIVDAGLKLVSLELEDQEHPRIAASAVAATVEETLIRVASLPDHVLDSEDLLEGFALEAFEQAAAANLPAIFPDATYRRRPDLLEGGVNAAWIMTPLRRPRYKRCSRTFKVRITPQMAEAVEGFEGTPLAEYFQDQLGVAEGEDLEAEVHLYEVLPGGTAADITRSEGEVPGLGAADEVTLAQLQPLTHEAAGVLLGRPGLGRPLPAGANVRRLASGQRVYHMVVGRRPLTVTGPHGRARVRRLARVDVALDTTRDEIRVRWYLSEVKAQRLAVRLRQQSHAGSLAAGFTRMLGRALPAILGGRRPRRFRLVHAGVAPGDKAVAAQLRASIPPVFVSKLQEWLVAGFAEFARANAPKFLAAAEDPADGVTVVFTIAQPPGLKDVAQAIAQKSAPPAAVSDALGKAAAPAVRVEAFAGLKRD